MYDYRLQRYVLLCRVFLGVGECRRCGLLSAPQFCELCRLELGVLSPPVAHDALIA